MVTIITIGEQYVYSLNTHKMGVYIWMHLYICTIPVWLVSQLTNHAHPIWTWVLNPISPAALSLLIKKMYKSHLLLVSPKNLSWDPFINLISASIVMLIVCNSTCLTNLPLLSHPQPSAFDSNQMQLFSNWTLIKLRFSSLATNPSCLNVIFYPPYWQLLSFSLPLDSGILILSSL